MNLIKQNKPAARPSDPQTSTPNVSTYVKKEEKVYVRRYAMSEGRRRRWLENYKKAQADDIMFPSKKPLKAEEATLDDKREKAKILLICLGIALILLLIWPMARFAASHLVVENVRIEGSDAYSGEEILETAELGIGDSLPIFKVKAMENALRASLPYLKSCNTYSLAQCNRRSANKERKGSCRYRRCLHDPRARACKRQDLQRSRFAS